MNISHRSLFVWVTLSLIFIVGFFLYGKKLLSDLKDRNYSKLPVLQTVANFSFTERGEEKVSQSDLLGKVWVANFFFSTCQGPCPRLTEKMKEIEVAVKRIKNIRLVSFTVDPKTDTPEILSAYAASYAASPTRWLFLTGEKEKLWTLIQKSFFLPVADNPPEAPPEEGPVVHTTRLVLVDAQGRVRGYYDGLAIETLPKIVGDIGSLLHEAGLQ